MNIMLVTVRERTKGNWHPQGAGGKNSVILKQFLHGIHPVCTHRLGERRCHGVLLSVLAEKAIGLSVQISLFSIGASVVFSAIIGILFGIIPAFKAARLDPSQSLRHS